MSPQCNFSVPKPHHSTNIFSQPTHFSVPKIIRHPKNAKTQTHWQSYVTNEFDHFLSLYFISSQLLFVVYFCLILLYLLLSPFLNRSLCSICVLLTFLPKFIELQQAVSCRNVLSLWHDRKSFTSNNWKTRNLTIAPIWQTNNKTQIKTALLRTGDTATGSCNGIATEATADGEKIGVVFAASEFCNAHSMVNKRHTETERSWN